MPYNLRICVDLLRRPPDLRASDWGVPVSLTNYKLHQLLELFKEDLTIENVLTKCAAKPLSSGGEHMTRAKRIALSKSVTGFWLEEEEKTH